MKYLVQGNYRQFKVTLTQRQGELITPYVPTDADEVSIMLRGARTYEYPDYEQSSNVLTFTDNGCLKVGLYALEVKIVESTTHRLRCMYREQIRVVASNDDVPTNADFEQDDIELQGQFDIAASVIVVDDELSLTSTNPVQNKVITAALDSKVGYLYSYEDMETGFDKIVIRIFGQSNDEDRTDVTDFVLGCVGDGGAYSEFSTVGLMHIEDKNKLDDIEAEANRIDGISADAASGGYMVYLKNGNTTVASVGIPWAWNSQDGGFMARTDYDRLHNSVGDSLGVGYTAGGLEIELKCGNTTLSYASIPFASAQADGLMSAADYSKLAALPTNADLTTALNGKQATLTWDSVPTQGSNNPVTSGGLYVVLGDIESILDNINGD